MAEAMFEYTPQHVGDLALKVGDKVEVTQKGDDGWWTGSLRGAQGNFPGKLEISRVLFLVTNTRVFCAQKGDDGGWWAGSRNRAQRNFAFL